MAMGHVASSTLTELHLMSVIVTMVVRLKGTGFRTAGEEM
jgi:hypothetical protein